VYDYNMASRTRELKKQQPVLGGYDPRQYESERLYVPARDGAQIPVSLVRRKDSRRNGGSPLLLYGYGSYGINIDPTFNSQRVSLLDRGFTYAIAHIRGGADMGRRWYEEGKLLKKKNTFTDFIDVAQFLVDHGYTSPDKLAIQGGSAGGLLMGAVINLRPDLFQSVIAQVPFVDVLTTDLDPTLPLTIGEYEEWGNANEQPYYDYIKSYSPYDNIERKSYPNILVMTGLNDPRVSYWEPAKWTAKLRAMKTDKNLLLLKTSMNAGHGGASDRYEKLRETTFIYAFLLRTILRDVSPS
jgi:oligopeptidase B